MILTPAVKFLDLIFRNNFFIFNFSKMCSQEHVRQLLQMVPTS